MASDLLSIEVSGGIGGLGLGVNAAPPRAHRFELDRIQDSELRRRIDNAFSVESLSTGEQQHAANVVYDGLIYKISRMSGGPGHEYTLDDAVLSDEQKDLIDILLHEDVYRKPQD